MPTGIYERKTYRNKPIRKLRNKRRRNQTTLVVGPPDDPNTYIPTADDPHLETFSTGAVRRAVTTPSRTDLIPLQALLALGERYHYGATVRGYGERNWEKGITYSNLLQHIQVHLQQLCHQMISPIDPLGRKVEAGQKFLYEDSPRQNAAAAMWGLAAIIHFLHFGNPAEEV